MVNCCVKGCKSRSEQNYENITFHTFPKNVTVRNVWISATGRLNWEPTKYSRICSKHFKDHCFRKTQYKVYLNKFSFPTLTIHDALPRSPSEDHDWMESHLETSTPPCDDHLDESLPSTSNSKESQVEITCLKNSLGLPLFSEEQQFHIGEHYALLIKAICKKYLNVRIHYATKSMVDKKENIRNMYTKLILFKGQ